MPRTKKSETETASIVENEKKTIETETPEVEVTETKPENDKPAKGKKDKVLIKCENYAGMSIILPTRTIELDEKGCCEVTGEEAERLLTIPGYELAK